MVLDRRCQWIVLAMLVASSSACESGTTMASGDTSTSADTETDGCLVGSEGCECTDGGGCDPGLVCYSNLCVDAGATGVESTGSTSGVDPDSTGADTTSGPVAECGDGIAGGEEACDGADLAGATCVSEGFDLGRLACLTDCSGFDSRDCRDAVCGDGAVEADEECEEDYFLGATCRSRGFDTGALACGIGCELDTSGCGTCGNESIDGDELCDGVDLGGQTCLTEGFDSGALACAPTCQALDPSGCGICGNGVADGGETCDGTDLGAATCVTEGFDSGSLTCTPGCEVFDTTGCGTCGNDLIDGSEVCDGADLGGATCGSEGFDSGVLACAGTCGSFSTLGCGVCGNGVIDGDEECDGADLGGATCGSLGFDDGGTLSCSPTCTYQLAQCCGSAPGGMTLQQQIDAAVDDDVLFVEPTVENVVVAGKRITLRGDCGGDLTTWTCADVFDKAIRVEAGADLTVEGFVFEGCNGSALAADLSGVVEFALADRLVLRRNVFRNNSAYRGVVVDNHFGGYLPPTAEIVIEHNIIHDNVSDDGGVIYLTGPADITIHNNLIYDNVANDYCGAVWLRDQVQNQLTFTKNVVWNNSADRNPALEVFSGQGAIVNSSIVGNNSPSNMSIEWGQAFSSVGGNPMFTNPGAGDFSLVPGSPAIDAGDPGLPLDGDGTVTDQGVDLDQLPTEPP